MSGASPKIKDLPGLPFPCLYWPVLELEGAKKLPFALKILAENVMRNVKDETYKATLLKRIVEAGLAGAKGEEIEFAPARVLFQDFTGVPVFVDFAVMREACEKLGGDPKRINPLIPCDLVIDHSVIADEAGCDCALEKNMQLEFERNKERYEFLNWAQSSFENVRIVAPGQGICHQLNIEALAEVVCLQDGVAYFDTVVGTDSHTPTANGIGVLGWGVGGIEAEAAALGQAITTLVPSVVGIKLTGKLRDGVAAMDVALSFAERLRAQGVVGSFVECFGPGLSSLSATQRSCIANMTPEYGSTCTLFPVDEQAIAYLRLTGRSEEQCALVETYAKAQGLWHEADEERLYAQVIEFDLSAVRPSAAGPSRPHDRVDVAALPAYVDDICHQRSGNDLKCAQVEILGQLYNLQDGAIAIAAITSCTTATDPSMMLACGLLAKHAAEAGLRSAPWVKTILAPGSHAVELLLKRANLLEPLERLGFYTCGFGCMSCIGNSGPLSDAMHNIASDIELTSVLSGNRNFDGRISPDVSQNYLAAPLWVVAYALAGSMRFDFEREPLGINAQGEPVFLADIMPDQAEIDAALQTWVDESLYAEGNRNIFAGDDQWQAIKQTPSDIFAWNEASTYVRRATYFDGMTLDIPKIMPIKHARALALLGDFITTDHISPAGAIAPDSPAAAYLIERGVEREAFNTYGSRRGNHEIMARGSFGNVKLQNKLADGRKGGWTRDVSPQDSGSLISIYEAACRAAQEKIDLVVLAGKMYGSGSSRDWAAKGPSLLGVRAVLAESFERIHRSNLIGMGILPLQLQESVEELGLDGNEIFSIEPVVLKGGMPSPRMIEVCAQSDQGKETRFMVEVRIDTPTEGHYWQHGGILPYVLRNLVEQAFA